MTFQNYDADRIRSQMKDNWRMAIVSMADNTYIACDDNGKLTVEVD